MRQRICLTLLVLFAAALTTSAQNRLRDEPGPSPVPAPTLVLTDGGEVLVRFALGGAPNYLTPAAVLEGLVPGTRSLWLEVDGVRTRFDLPGVELSEEVEAKHLHGSEVWQLTLAASFLLPGFKLYAAWQEPDQPPSPIVHVTGRGPVRLAEVHYHEKAATLRVHLPLFEARRRGTYYFMLVNPDGSRSRTISLSRQGNALEGQGKTAKSARPAPVDEPVQVPGVELLGASQAMERARQAGFVPVLVDASTYTEATLVDGEDEPLVLKQGLPPEAQGKRGDVLLLSVKAPRSEASAPLYPLPIDVGDMLGFVPLPRGPAGNVGPGAVPSDQPGLFARDDAESAANAVPIGSDPGICLDQGRTRDDLGQAALLRLTLDALCHRVKDDLDIPGNLGKVLTEALRVAEKEIRAAVTSMAAGEAPADARKVPVHLVLEVVEKHLSLELTAAGRQAALDGWAREHANRLHPAQLDRNDNRFLADDVAIWFLAHLSERGPFAPATAVQLQTDAQGQPQAVLGGGPGQGGRDWLKAFNLAKLFTTTPLKPLPPNLTPAKKDAPKKIDIPKGPAQVSDASKPDHVKTPAVEELKLQTALAKLEELGLNADPQARKARPTDVVLFQQPKANTWVPLGAQVTLTPGTQVPSLNDLDLAQALQRLKDAQLAADFPSGTSQKAKVVGQSVPAGKLVAYNTRVTLTLKDLPPPDTTVLVPDFRGLTQFAASNLAGQKGLDVKFTIVTRLTQDQNLVGKVLVESQSLAPGSRVQRFTPLTLSLARYQRSDTPPPTDKTVLVPGFVGLAQTSADNLARQTGLEAKFTIVTRLTKDNSLIGKTVVEKQSLAQGTRVPRGTTITLSLARYLKSDAPPPPVSKKVKVPSLANATYNTVRSELQAAGLKMYLYWSPEGASELTAAEYNRLSKFYEFRAIRQTPAAGALVDPGTLVRVEFDIAYFFKGGKKVPNPRYKGPGR